MRSSSWPPGRLKRIQRDGSNVTTTRTDANQMAEWEEIMSSSFLCVCVCVASVAHAGRKEDTPSSSLNELRQRPPMLQPPPRSLLQNCWQCPFKCELSLALRLCCLLCREQSNTAVVIWKIATEPRPHDHINIVHSYSSLFHPFR